MPQPGDVFQERLYCIRWVDAEGRRRYAASDDEDSARETRVLELLRDRFADWQRQGFIPSKVIVSGYNTDQPVRERGWAHWHHLFTPRQLLTHGLLAESSNQLAPSKAATVGGLLGLGRVANWDSRLCRWVADKSKEGGSDTFSNQALNTLANFSVRPLRKLVTAWPLFTEGATWPAF